MYIDMEGGDLYLALGRYNGSRGKPQYPSAVFAAGKNWEFDSTELAAPASPDPSRGATRAPGGPN